MAELSTWKIAADGNFETNSTGYGTAVEVTQAPGAERLEELARIRLLTTLAEDQFALDLGLPYKSIFGEYNASFIEAEVLRTLLRDPEIESVRDIFVDLSDPVKRRVNVSVRIVGIGGATAILEVLI